jgi:hypothetical protein
MVPARMADFPKNKARPGGSPGKFTRPDQTAARRPGLQLTTEPQPGCSPGQVHTFNPSQPGHPTHWACLLVSTQLPCCDCTHSACLVGSVAPPKGLAPEAVTALEYSRSPPWPPPQYWGSHQDHAQNHHCSGHCICHCCSHRHGSSLYSM